MKRNVLYALLVTALTSSTISHGYKLYLRTIVNDTPNTITFIGKEIAFPAAPTAPMGGGFAAPSQAQKIRRAQQLVQFPIVIPGNSFKYVGRTIITDAESKSGGEIFLNFKDYNGQLYSIVVRPGRIFSLSLLPGMRRTEMKFNPNQKDLNMEFKFSGKKGIENIGLTSFFIDRDEP